MLVRSSLGSEFASQCSRACSSLFVFKCVTRFIIGVRPPVGYEVDGFIRMLVGPRGSKLDDCREVEMLAIRSVCVWCRYTTAPQMLYCLVHVSGLAMMYVERALMMLFLCAFSVRSLREKPSDVAFGKVFKFVSGRSRLARSSFSSVCPQQQLQSMLCREGGRGAHPLGCSYREP